jgi:hypothetical protein
MRLDWEGPRLLVHLVNPESGYIAIRAEHFLKLVDDMDTYRLLARKGAQAIEKWGYHGGDVVACADFKKDWYKISVFYGSRTKRLEYDEESGDVVGFVSVEAFCLPGKEMKPLIEAARVMLSQVTDYDDMRLGV